MAKSDRRPEPQYRVFALQQCRGGGYRMIEAVVPESAIAPYVVEMRAPDMRGIVAAHISQRIDTAPIPGDWETR